MVVTYTTTNCYGKCRE